MKAILASVTVLCPKCGQPMAGEIIAIEGEAPERVIVCTTRNCKAKKIRYRQPTIELEAFQK